ncbi:MAG: type II secretion system GspH family protein [Azoarcus sp.]|jgi:Tfp pilus assembly protein FimT|nr:type II secretion system GspH family protein [Azoarcus sp.]
MMQSRIGGRGSGVFPRPRACVGVTLIELVVVIILTGILATIVVPKMTDSSAFDRAVFRDSLMATLRYAQKTAVSHRRMVCANVEAQRVSLSIAVAHGATACSAALPGPDGKAEIVAKEASVSPAATLFFQPNGDITTDTAGTVYWNDVLTVTDASPIQIVGATGYVQ